jgi:phosphohistidine phosphatase
MLCCARLLELYLLRHGIAEQRSATGADRDRALTADGVTRVRGVMDRAKAAGFAPKWIVASPYLRAQQTARVAAEVLGYREPILGSAALVPESSPAAVLAEAKELDDGPLLFVAHEPLLSGTAAWLTGETRVMIEFQPATLVAITFDAWPSLPLGRVKATFHAT